MFHSLQSWPKIKPPLFLVFVFRVVVMLKTIYSTMGQRQVNMSQCWSDMSSLYVEHSLYCIKYTPGAKLAKRSRRCPRIEPTIPYSTTTHQTRVLVQCCSNIIPTLVQCLLIAGSLRQQAVGRQSASVTFVGANYAGIVSTRRYLAPEIRISSKRINTNTCHSFGLGRWANHRRAGRSVSQAPAVVNAACFSIKFLNKWV